MSRDNEKKSSSEREGLLAWPIFLRKFLLILAELAFICFWLLAAYVVPEIREHYASMSLELHPLLKWFFWVCSIFEEWSAITSVWIGILVGWLVLDWMFGSWLNRFLSIAYSLVLFGLVVGMMAALSVIVKPVMPTGHPIFPVLKSESETPVYDGGRIPAGTRPNFGGQPTPTDSAPERIDPPQPRPINASENAAPPFRELPPGMLDVPTPPGLNLP